jgi:hypothetical protein
MFEEREDQDGRDMEEFDANDENSTFSSSDWIDCSVAESNAPDANKHRAPSSNTCISCSPLKSRFAPKCQTIIDFFKKKIKNQKESSSAMNEDMS